MQITIYSGFSKEANSTKQPTGGTAVSCTLKENTSIINPVFVLQGANFSTNYVSWNGRYYFVDDVVSVRNGAVEVHCSVDVLATYKSEIGSSTQYVTRAASSSDDRIVDSLYPMLPFADYETVSMTTIHGVFSNNSTYVIGVVGQNQNNGVVYYALTDSQFSAFMNYLFGGTFLNAPTTEISVELQKELVNPIQYIVTALWFPLIINGVNDTIKFGYWDSGISAKRIDENYSKGSTQQNFTVPLHPQHQSVGSYLNSNPYTQIVLECYSFGTIPIDASLFSQFRTGTLEIETDFYTGTGYLKLYNGNNLVNKIAGQIGVPIQISQVNQNLIQSAVGVVGSIGALATGNFIGVLSGVGDAVNGLLPQLSSQGAQGSRIAYNQAPRLTIIYRRVASTDITRLGKPLMQPKVLNTLSGFIQVERPDVNISGTPGEKDKIAGYMESGFFYE